MKSFGTNEMLSIANELNYNFFLCDESIMNWHHLSTPFLRILKISSEQMKADPLFWISLVDWEGEDPYECLRKWGENEDSFNLHLPFSIGISDRINILIRISRPYVFNSSRVFRIGSAEIDGEGGSYKQEALQARDNEIEISARIQKTLLTGSISRKNKVLDIEAETIPSKNVDGDFYEFLQLTPDVMDFMIGDVMGKGVPAALLAAAVKTAYYKSVIIKGMGKKGLPGLDSMLCEMDRLINRNLVELKKFLTLYFCRLDMEQSLLSFIDAGHTSFIYLDAENGSCWNVKGSNMPLGFTESQEFRTFLLPFNRDDILFFYSDGVTEVCNSEGDMFGSERLRQLILAHRHLDSKSLLKKVFNVTFYFASQTFDDDVTGVAIKVAREKPPPLIRKRLLYTAENPADLEELREEFDSALQKHFPADSGDDCTRLTIALLEACGNCIVHGEGSFGLDWRIYHRSVEIILEFSSSEYNWYTHIDPLTGSYQTNGYGSFLIFQGTDSALLMKGGENHKRLILYKEFFYE